MTTIFQEIDTLHAEWSRMDKVSRLGWLTGAKMRLNRLANQFAQHVSLKGGSMSNVERDYAHRLLEMIDAVDREGAKVTNDLANDAFKEIIKRLTVSI